MGRRVFRNGVTTGTILIALCHNKRPGLYGFIFCCIFFFHFCFTRLSHSMLLGTPPPPYTPLLYKNRSGFYVLKVELNEKKITNVFIWKLSFLQSWTIAVYLLRWSFGLWLRFCFLCRVRNQKKMSRDVRKLVIGFRPAADPTQTRHMVQRHRNMARVLKFRLTRLSRVEINMVKDYQYEKWRTWAS